MNLFKLGILAVAALGLTACVGEKVQIPPAHVGVILEPTGYSPDIREPSVFRLDFCWLWEVCDKLVLIETSDVKDTESFTNFQPENQLDFNFNTIYTYSVINDDTTLRATLDRVRPEETTGRVMRITADQIYQLYGYPTLRDVVRSVVAEYRIEDIQSNRDAINQEISQRLNNQLSTSAPLRFSYIGLGDTDFPDVIREAQAARAKREVEIATAEADKAVRLVEAQAALEVAQANREVRLTIAQTAKEENDIIAASASTGYLAYRRLEVLEALANSDGAVFIPWQGVDEVGASVAMFNPRAQ